MDLISLAERYETKEFLIGDPSWFMHQVEGDANKELLAFIASCLSYGSRKQFLPKIQKVLDWSHGDVEGWLSSGQYATDIPRTPECYYRLYTNAMMNDMLRALAEMIRQHGSMRGFVESLAGRNRKSGIPGETGTPGNKEKLSALDVVKALTQWFASHGSEGIVPKNTQSSCKRICMFLRWMVRDSSPVDLGLWKDIIDKKSLIIPMDTHVMQEARSMGFLSSSTASMTSAIRLSQRLAEIFPDDPMKGDFALFGKGVSGNLQE